MESSSSSFFAQNNTDVTVVVTDVLNERLQKLLHSFSSTKQNGAANNSNYVKDKIVEVDIEKSTVITLPRLSLIQNSYGEIFKTLIFVQSAFVINKFTLLVEFQGKVLTKKAKLFCDDFLSCVIQDVQVKGSHLSRSAKYKGFSTSKILQLIANGNVRFHHLMHYTPEPLVDQHNQILDNGLVIFTKALYKKALELYSLMYKYGTSEELSELNQLSYQDRLFRLRHTDYGTLKRNLLNEAYINALRQLIDDNRADEKYFNTANDAMPITQFINMHLDHDPQAFINAVFRPDQSSGVGESTTCVHPHPLVYIQRSILDLQRFDVLELGYYDSSFWFSLMLCGRWFSKVILTEDHLLSSNHSALYMYGKAGAGKSEIVSTLCQYMNSYKWQTKAKGDNFQSPALLSASSIVLEEFPPEYLCESSYKQILDINSSFKIDIKLQHPINATEKTPAMITSNPSPVDKYHTILSMINLNKTAIDRDSLEAGYRRVCLVPFHKSFKLTYVAPPVPEAGQFDYKLFFDQFKDRKSLRPQMFNFIYAFACLQKGDYQINDNFAYYTRNILEKFQNTVFGQYYLINKDEIDKTLTQLEQQLQNLTTVSDSIIEQNWDTLSRDYDMEFRVFTLELIGSTDTAKQLSDIFRCKKTPHYLKMMRICQTPFIFQKYQFKVLYDTVICPSIYRHLDNTNCKFIEDDQEEDYGDELPKYMIRKLSANSTDLRYLECLENWEHEEELEKKANHITSSVRKIKPKKVNKRAQQEFAPDFNIDPLNFSILEDQEDEVLDRIAWTNGIKRQKTD